MKQFYINCCSRPDYCTVKWLYEESQLFSHSIYFFDIQTVPKLPAHPLSCSFTKKKCFVREKPLSEENSVVIIVQLDLTRRKWQWRKRRSTFCFSSFPRILTHYWPICSRTLVKIDNKRLHNKILLNASKADKFMPTTRRTNCTYV